MFYLVHIRLALICSLLIPSIYNYASGFGTVLQEQQLNDKISFIGEVKDYSYIKVDLEPVKTASGLVPDSDVQLNYKGSYYESATGHKYRITGVFSVDGRSWIFRCFNANNREVFVFKGKQKQDGSIDGTWVSKEGKHAFYLRPQ